jgi:hypothetical protein
VKHGGNPLRLFRSADQAHARLLWGVPALAMVALKTACNYIFPGFGAALYDGDNVVEREVFGGALFPAILTGVVIPGVDVRPTKLGALKMLPDFNVFEKPEDAGHLNGETDASDFAIIFCKNFNLALTKQTECTFPGYYVYGFITCI